MTSDITIGKYKLVKPAKVKWKTTINSFTDTCTIDLPRITYMRTEKQSSEDLDENTRPEYDIRENDPVSVSLGYDGRNYKRFEGFVKRVNDGMPVQIECEGYSYLLYDIIFTKSYQNTTVKQLLTDLVKDTKIVLSDAIADVPLGAVRFKEATGIQVLEWLVKECKLVVHFNFNELYCGLRYASKGESVKLRLGWNTVKEDGFKKRFVDKNVRIVIKEKNEEGKVKKIKSDSKYNNETAVKIRKGFPAEALKEIANRLQTKSNYQGYQGTLVLFLEPYVSKGSLVEVDGYKYPEKSGRFFAESISGEFSKSGGRQTVELTYFFG